MYYPIYIYTGLNIAAGCCITIYSMSNHLLSCCSVSHVHFTFELLTQRLVSCTGGRLLAFDRASCNILSFHIKCCASGSLLQSSQINGRQLKRQHDLSTSSDWYFLFKCNTMAAVIPGQLLNIAFQKHRRLPQRLSLLELNQRVFQWAHFFLCPVITLLI